MKKILAITILTGVLLAICTNVSAQSMMTDRVYPPDTLRFSPSDHIIRTSVFYGPEDGRYMNFLMGYSPSGDSISELYWAASHAGMGITLIDADHGLFTTDHGMIQPLISPINYMVKSYTLKSSTINSSVDVLSAKDVSGSDVSFRLENIVAVKANPSDPSTIVFKVIATQ